MRVARSIPEVREHVTAARRAGRTIGFVPTMGAFHPGHEALMRAAREACDEVVVSLFVNPTQFDEPGDFAAYPRVEEDDATIAERAGAGLLFAPSAREMYPAGFATRITVAGLSEVLEGRHRRGHFDGVCTVVAKLLAIVAPDVAFFGAKDAQQLLIVRRMVADLDLPVSIREVPTVREADGLAMSSRNRRLSGPEREQALALPRVLQAAAAAIAAGERDPARVRSDALAHAGTGIDFEYLAIADPATLEEPALLEGPLLVAAAARVGAVRLIDNLSVTSPPRPSAPPAPAVGAAKETA